MSQTVVMDAPGKRKGIFIQPPTRKRINYAKRVMGARLNVALSQDGLINLALDAAGFPPASEIPAGGENEEE